MALDVWTLTEVVCGAFSVFLTWTIWLTLAALAINTLIYLTRGMLRSKRRLDGKVFVITGANQGIGFETALELARRGGHVVLACRNLERAQNAKQRIEDALNKSEESTSETVGRASSELSVRKTANGDASKVAEAAKGRVTIIQLDLCSFASVRRFVTDLSKVVGHVDVLINNAGIIPHGKKRVCTEDGLEETFQANYFGHFLLTNLMLPLIQKAPQGRIINVTSLLYLFGRVNLAEFEDNVKNAGGPWGGSQYMHTKLAIVMWTRELANRIKFSGVTANCVHPGLVSTQIGAEQNNCLAIAVHFFALLFGKSPHEGAQTQLHVAIKDIGAKTSGAYFQDCRRTPLLRGTNRITNKIFWDMTERIIKNAGGYADTKID